MAVNRSVDSANDGYDNVHDEFHNFVEHRAVAQDVNSTDDGYENFRILEWSKETRLRC